MNTTIARAIAVRTIVEFDYNNERRLVEPYAHGQSDLGKELLRAFQIDNGSQSNKSLGWKLFDIAKMSNLRLTPRTFTTNRPHYNPNDSALNTIYSCV